MNGSQVCLLLYCVVLMGTSVLANDGKIKNETEKGAGANPNATMGPPGTTHLTQFNSSTHFQSESTTPATLNTRETSGTNSPVNTNNTPSRANTKPSAYPPLKAQTSPTFSPCRSSDFLLDKKEATILLIVTGALVVLCAILLVSTVVLSCHVCCLKRQPHISSRPIRSNIDLVSGTGYWGTGQRTKERPDSEPGETSLMMAELRQTQEGENGKTDKGQGKNKMVKDTPKKEEKKEATENGVAAAANPSQGSPVTTTTKQPAEPSDPTATAVSPQSQASSDVVVVVG
ncbi:protein EVI2A-like [Oncorhynchus clarkii lewisi]|uniref:protein EVI2A-like n=1 Tax=Oncorhynchus clarkii lewisi TaxID=490388 RepID=UPI0039B90056